MDTATQHIQTAPDHVPVPLHPEMVQTVRLLSKDEYLALPWDLIRTQYENTDISIRKLARLHGLSSKTTLLRKIKGEDWTRHAGATATHLSQLQIPGVGSGPIPEVEREERKERVDAQSRRDEGNAATILTADELAALQSAGIRRQTALAEEIQEGGLAILRLLIDVLKAPEASVGDHIKRLTAASLTALLKSAVESIYRGVIIERRALGMDAVNGVVPKADAPAAPTDNSEAAMNLVKKLGLPFALQLRKLIAAHLETRRDSRSTG
jgi:hypothetical protein